jgi:hypothetical protein
VWPFLVPDSFAALVIVSASLAGNFWIDDLSFY